MRRLALMGVVAVMVSVLTASGVALAMTINCKVNITCNGTKNSDTMTGTTGNDNMFGRGGKDTMKGKAGSDDMEGGTGADKVIGGADSDSQLWGGTAAGGTYPDNSDDTVRGAQGNDEIEGGFGQGGVDHIFGGDGNDEIDVTQRVFRIQVPIVKVTKEVVDCGAGDDLVYLDDAVDVIANNCEVQKRFS